RRTVLEFDRATRPHEDGHSQLRVAAEVHPLAAPRLGRTSEPVIRGSHALADLPHDAGHIGLLELDHRLALAGTLFLDPFVADQGIRHVEYETLGQLGTGLGLGGAFRGRRTGDRCRRLRLLAGGEKQRQRRDEQELLHVVSSDCTVDWGVEYAPSPGSSTRPWARMDVRTASKSNFRDASAADASAATRRPGSDASPAS